MYLFLISYTQMKKLVKKVVHKPEAERTRKEKILRDVAFFGVVIYAAVMTFLVFDTKATEVETEAAALTAQMNVNQVALLK